jgi:hypothetical protein
MCRKQFHLQIKAEQKEIIQNVLERKDSMAECYQRAWERACVTSPLFGQGMYYINFFFLMVICNHDFPLDPMIFVISYPFWNICHVTSRKLRLPQCIMGDDLHINKQTNICIANHRRYRMCWKEKIQWQCYQRASERACVTSPLFGQGTRSYFFSLRLSVIHYCC